MLRSWSVNTLENKKLAMACASALVLTFFPKALTPVFFRLPKKPMTIHVTREVPPREAFDDLFYTPEVDKEWDEIKSSPTTNLNEETHQTSYNWSPANIGQRRVFLPPTSFNKEMISNGGGSLAENGSAWIAELPTSERKRLEEADNRSQVMSQDWSLPSWRSVVAEKVEQARKSAPYPTSKIYVAAKAPNGEMVTPDSFRMADVQMVSEKINQTPEGKTRLSGNLRLAPGLALGDRVLEVRRFVDGIPVEAGSISTEKGTFTIDVEDLQGVVSVELSDATGTILASGNHRLMPADDLKKIDINVAARSQFAGTFVNFNRDPSRLISEKLSSTRGEPAEILYASLGVQDRTDALGSFVFPKVSESSFGLIRSHAKGFADSLTLIGAGEPKGIALFPNQLILALKEIIHGPKKSDASPLGLVWGQAVFDGKPIPGISVSLQEDPEAKPIYLNGFVPQTELATTTENGYFIFPGLSKGMHIILASLNGEKIGHLNIEVDDNSVSTGNLEISTKKQSAQIKVYDAFDGSPQMANLQLQSTPEPLPVAGQASVQLPQVQRLSYGYVQPQLPEYLPYQFAYNDMDDFIHAPLIKTEWLDALSSERRVTTAPDTGTIVGFVPEDNFEAALSQEDSYDSSNIIYFDPTGKVSTTGVAGGGFIMFNVPQGTQTVAVMSKKTEMLSTQVLPVDSNSTSVLKLRF